MCESKNVLQMVLQFVLHNCACTKCPWARYWTQSAPDVLVGTLHGSHRHQCMNLYMNYCKLLCLLNALNGNGNTLDWVRKFPPLREMEETWGRATEVDSPRTDKTWNRCCVYLIDQKSKITKWRIRMTKMWIDWLEHVWRLWRLTNIKPWGNYWSLKTFFGIFQ